MRTETLKQEDGSKSLYYYDEDGKEIRIEDYDPDGNIFMVIERQYDSRGICLGWLVNDGSGKLIKRFVVKFDENGTEVKTEQYGSSGELEEVFTPDGASGT